MDRAAKRDAIDAMKIAAGCVDCGYNAHPRALQFDHRGGETKGRAQGHSYRLGWSWQHILDELAKCVVRCANCHAIRTAGQYPYTVPAHGTRRRYVEGCRCDLCRAAEAAYRAAYRKRAATRA